MIKNKFLTTSRAAESEYYTTEKKQRIANNNKWLSLLSMACFNLEFHTKKLGINKRRMQKKTFHRKIFEEIEREKNVHAHKSFNGVVVVNKIEIFIR